MANCPPKYFAVWHSPKKLLQGKMPPRWAFGFSSYLRGPNCKYSSCGWNIEGTWSEFLVLWQCVWKAPSCSSIWWLKPLPRIGTRNLVGPTSPVSLWSPECYNRLGSDSRVIIVFLHFFNHHWSCKKLLHHRAFRIIPALQPPLKSRQHF